VKTKFNFVKTTLKFSLAGVFIPGFTAILLMGIQMLLTACGIECSISWIIIWMMSSIGAITVPIFFVRKINRSQAADLGLRSNDLIFFNLVEYTFLQGSLSMLFSNAHTLCYVSDGQNGLQFVFTGWIALPVLILLSFYFEYREEI
jgi:hypothetical protein